MLKLVLICDAADVSIVPDTCTRNVMLQARSVVRHFFRTGKLKGLEGSDDEVQVRNSGEEFASAASLLGLGSDGAEQSAGFSIISSDREDRLVDEPDVGVVEEAMAGRFFYLGSRCSISRRPLNARYNLLLSSVS